MSSVAGIDPEIVNLGVKHSRYYTWLSALYFAMRDGVQLVEAQGGVEESAKELEGALVRCGIDIIVPTKFDSAEGLLSFFSSSHSYGLAIDISNQLVRLYSTRQERIFYFVSIVAGLYLPADHIAKVPNEIRGMIEEIRKTGPSLKLPEEIVQRCIDDPKTGLALLTHHLEKTEEERKAASKLSYSINLFGSVGILNTGEIENVKSILVNMSSLQDCGYSEVAAALKELTEAVAGCRELPSEKRAEVLDHLEELSRQATLEPEKRAKPGVLRGLFSGMATTLGAAGGLAGAWSTWGPAIKAFFGL